jgi:hypothetical protein
VEVLSNGKEKAEKESKKVKEEKVEEVFGAMFTLLVEGLGAFVGVLLAGVAADAVKDNYGKDMDENTIMGVKAGIGAAFFLLGWFLSKKLKGIAASAVAGLGVGGVAYAATVVYEYAKTQMKSNSKNSQK